MKLSAQDFSRSAGQVHPPATSPCGCAARYGCIGALMAPTTYKLRPQGKVQRNVPISQKLEIEHATQQGQA
eukprot:1611754-Prymnesium_polylepis.2